MQVFDAPVKEKLGFLSQRATPRFGSVLGGQMKHGALANILRGPGLRGDFYFIQHGRVWNLVFQHPIGIMQQARLSVPIHKVDLVFLHS